MQDPDRERTAPSKPVYSLPAAITASTRSRSAASPTTPSPPSSSSPFALLLPPARPAAWRLPTLPASFPQRHHPLVQRRRHRVLAPEPDDPSVQPVDLRAPPRLHVLQHRRLVVVGHAGGRAGV